MISNHPETKRLGSSAGREGDRPLSLGRALRFLFSPDCLFFNSRPATTATVVFMSGIRLIPKSPLCNYLLVEEDNWEFSD